MRGKRGGPAGGTRRTGAQRNRRGGQFLQEPAGSAGSKLENEIVSLFYQAEGSLSLPEIIKGLELGRSYRKELNNLLADLCHRKLLTCEDKLYTLRTPENLVEGTVSLAPAGYAFVAVEQPPPGLKIDKDIFVPAKALASANHGDRVLVHITGTGRGRFEGTVLRILRRAIQKVVGIYLAGRSSSLVQPEEDRYPFQIIIRKEQSLGARNGEMVLAEILEYKPGARNPSGKIIEVLGNPDDLRVQTEISIRNFDLPHLFSDVLLKEVNNLDPAVVLGDDRTDLRQVPHVTIDGESARDFDDAVAIEKIAKGYRLHVSIADVSHYVKRGSLVDQEAYLRGTSVYFPSRVLPMLPERLSNDLCSLVPAKDRYTFTAVMEFDHTGKCFGKAFMKSIIRSRHRLTYTLVKQMLIDQDAAVRREYADIVDSIDLMGELALLLEKRRMKRGSIGFEIPEAEVLMGDDNTITDIVRAERNQAHKLIEEFMLAANEAVAETLADADWGTLYRIHEKPDPIKVADFGRFAQSLGLSLPRLSSSPEWFGKVLAATAGTPLEYIISNLLLRTMQQARYSPDNVGHFGLAAQFYTHFTSPIRRYPDLMVHRALADFLKSAGKGGSRNKGGQITLPEAGQFLSKRERIAVDAEREVLDRFKVHFMADKTGEVYEGIIAGVSSFGLFIELLGIFANGGVALTSLVDDYYELEESRHRYVGRRTGKIYQLGDLVRVRLESVEKRRRRLNFVIETR
jgi:ribonuclease R